MTIKLTTNGRSEWETLQDRRQFIELFFKKNPSAGTANASRQQLADELKDIKRKLNRLHTHGLDF